jgi:hypothetical protein
MAAGLERVPLSHDARAADRFAVRERLLAARRPYRPVNLSDPKELAERRYQQLLAMVPEADRTAEVREYLRRETESDSRTSMLRIPYVDTSFGEAGVVVEFAGIPPESLRTATEVMIRHRFFLRREDEWGGNGTLEWQMPTRSGLTAAKLVPFKSGAWADLLMRASVVLADGTAQARIINRNPPAAPASPDGAYQMPGVMFLPLRDGMEILIPVGRFDVNLAKAFLLLWIRFAALALVGVAANTFVSGPVAALALAGYVAVGMASGDLSRSLTRELEPWEKADAVASGRSIEKTPLEAIASSVAVAALALAPDHEQTDSMDDLLAGREIPWARAARQLALDLLLRGGLAAALGIAVFARRELAKPTALG